METMAAKAQNELSARDPQMDKSNVLIKFMGDKGESFLFKDGSILEFEDEYQSGTTISEPKKDLEIILVPVGGTEEEPSDEFVMLLMDKAKDGIEITLNQREVGMKVERTVLEEMPEVYLDKVGMEKELELLGLNPKVIKSALAEKNDELNNTYIEKFVSKITENIGSKFKRAGQKMRR
jgi:MinD-like ATPase involved in chromosome partitioning or flagellar assembly